MFVRINTGAAAVARDPALRHRLGVAVPLKHPNAQGLPTTDEANDLNEIEDALGHELRVGAETVLVVVITTSGFREFVYHTVSTNAQAAIASVQKRIVGHEIQLIEEDDPDWEVYGQFTGS